MEHFVTLFDAGFLPQGMALHRSMQRRVGDHMLWVLCVDELAHDVLTRLSLPNVAALKVGDLETDALKLVKPGRSRGEYCWTLTPFAADFVFQHDASVSRVTYVDADAWFAKSPRPVFEDFERSGKSVLITPHGYAAEYDQAHVTGEFCVQFVTFERARSVAVRERWQAQCLDWCFARSEDGKFGDQKYLDDWPRVFPDQVHVAGRLEYFQAPWNAVRFAPSECVLYHFHGLRLMRNGRVLLSGHYRIPASTHAIVYRPYLDDFAAALQQLAAVGFAPAPQLTQSPLVLRSRLLAIRARHRLRDWLRPDILALRRRP
jgi:hypothetical protein